MAYQRPLVLVNGQIEQLQAGDTLDPSSMLAGAAGPSGLSGPVGSANGVTGGDHRCHGRHGPHRYGGRDCAL